MTYAKKLQNPKWQRKRLEVLNRDGFTCQLCGDKETQLEVHHKKYVAGMPWESPLSDLQTLCRHCHGVIEAEEYKDDLDSPFKILKEVGFGEGDYFITVLYDFQVCSWDYCGETGEFTLRNRVFYGLISTIKEFY